MQTFSSLGFKLLKETPKASLWECPHGHFWEPKNQPIPRLSQFISDAIAYSTVVEVAIIERSEQGVRVEFQAQPILSRHGDDFSLGAVKSKTAWLPAAAVQERSGRTVCSPFWIKSALAELAQFGARKAGRRGPQPRDWQPVTARQGIDHKAFVEWFQQQRKEAEGRQAG